MTCLITPHVPASGLTQRRWLGLLSGQRRFHCNGGPTGITGTTPGRGRPGVKSTMKGRLVGKFGAEDRVASAQCHVEVVEGLDNGRWGLPAKVISYVLGITIGLVQSANVYVPVASLTGSENFVVTRPG